MIDCSIRSALSCWYVERDVNWCRMHRRWRVTHPWVNYILIKVDFCCIGWLWIVLAHIFTLNLGVTTAQVTPESYLPAATIVSHSVPHSACVDALRRCLPLRDGRR